MTQFSRLNYLKNTAHDDQHGQSHPPKLETVTRITDLIQLCVGILNGLIGLRFMLKLVASTGSFADAVYAVTSPFLRIFQGLTGTPSVRGAEVEFFSLIAILVYAMAGWILVQLVWILLAARK